MRTTSFRRLVSGLTIMGSLAFSPMVSLADARTFAVGEGSRVQFISDAPLETMRGTGNEMRGSISFDAANLSSARGTVELMVASMRTGIDLRDEHLRAANWLDAQRFPSIKFELTRVEGASALSPGQEQSVRLVGKMTMHGVTRDVTVPAKVKLEGNRVRIEGELPAKLEDYGVTVPQIVRLKIANEIQVKFTIVATAR